jgi:soluble lytic murein transglycosylase-like protein
MKIIYISLISLFLGTMSFAEQVVYFEDGRTLVIESMELDDQFMILEMEGGSRISVPQDRIASVETLVATAPSPSKSVFPASSVHAANPAWRAVAGQYAETIALAADRYKLNPELLTAMAQVESSFDPLAVSPQGAQGLLQLMPQTAKRFGVEDSFDVSQNVDAGARYMSWLLERCSGRTDLALAGYNAGEHAVDRYDGIPPYVETQTYVTRVLSRAGNLGLNSKSARLR